MPEVYGPDGPRFVSLDELEAKKAMPPPMPPPAAWYWRLWGVRHVRFAYHHYCMVKHYDMYQSIGMLPVNIDYDRQVLDAILRGEI